MILRWPQHPKNAHVRTCQECGHTQVSTDPATQKSDAWRDTKCRKCKSEGSMDYGSKNVEDINDEEFI